jgi:hypothetical protein
MASTGNGPDATFRDQARRLRVDDLTAIVNRNGARPRDAGASMPGLREHSGKLFVLLAGAIVLLIWGVLYLVFREWRAGYRERAHYGTTQVVPVIDPLRGVMPPGIEINAWRDAVDQTRAMLVTVTASNLLDIPTMTDLKVELAARVRAGCKRPAQAPIELAEIWNSVADRGEFLFRDSRSTSGDRHVRPSVLPTYGATRIAPALDPLRNLVPQGVDPHAWREGVESTRALVLSLTDANVLDVTGMRALRSSLEHHVAQAAAQPKTAMRELDQIWSETAKRRDELIGHFASPNDKGGERPAVLRSPLDSPVAKQR